MRLKTWSLVAGAKRQIAHGWTRFCHVQPFLPQNRSSNPGIPYPHVARHSKRCLPSNNSDIFMFPKNKFSTLKPFKLEHALSARLLWLAACVPLSGSLSIVKPPSWICWALLE